MIQLLKRLNKDFALTIVILFMALMSLNSLVVTNLIEPHEFFVLWLMLGAVFIVLYSIRFKRKPQVQSIDYVKLCIITIGPAIPVLNAYAFDNDMLLLGVVGVAYLPTLAFIYVIDRVIIKHETMNKKLVIVFAIMSFVVVVSIVYAFVQTVKAQAAERAAQAAKAESDTRAYEFEEVRRELEKTRAQLDSLKSKQ
jgi:hypothetical protein